MPNSIKYNTASESLALRRGNFHIGVGDTSKGTTVSTGYWNGIAPPPGGYTIYLNKASNGPAIYTPANDSDLINLTNKIANASYSTTEQCLSWFATQSDKMCFNADYNYLTTNGLVLCYDAGFSPSYPRNGETWFDLSQSVYNATLYNGAYYNQDYKSIAFDGGDEVAQTGYGPNLGDFTVCVLYRDKGSPAYGRLVDKLYYAGFWLGRNGGQSNSWGGGILEASDPYGIFLDLIDGRFNYLVSTRKGTDHNLYGNGVTNKTSNTVSSSALDSTTIAIGNWSGQYYNGQTFYGDIASVQVYDRALTESEILNNYYQGPMITEGLSMFYTAGNLVSYFSGSGITYNMVDDNGIIGYLQNGVNYRLEYGGYWIFDGFDDKILLSDSIYLPTTTDWTVNAWIKTSTSAAGLGEAPIFTNSSGGPVYSSMQLYAGKMAYYRYNNGWILEVGTTAVSNNVWHLLTWVNNSNQTMNLYVDGVLDSTVTSTTQTSNALDMIGGSWASAYTGSIGSLQVNEGKAFSAAEVKQNFNIQRTRFGV